MPTFPSPGISRNSTVILPIKIDSDRKQVMPDFRDVVRLLESTQRGQKVKDTDLGKAVDALYRAMKDVVARVNKMVMDEADARDDLVAQVNLLVTNLRVVDDKITRRVNDMLQWGTLANRPATKGLGRFYMATDQAAGSRLAFDDPAAGAWIAP